MKILSVLFSIQFGYYPLCPYLPTDTKIDYIAFWGGGEERNREAAAEVPLSMFYSYTNARILLIAPNTMKIPLL